MALCPSGLNAVASKLLISNTVKLCHTSAGKLRIPANLAEEAETQKVKFSPQRQRDTSGAHIAAKLNKAGSGPVFGRGLDSSACRNFGSSFNAGSLPKDRHVSVYDQSSACSLSSVMQTNVPQPFQSDGRGERSGHLTMPGGQWSQNDKYVSSDLHEHHYQNNLSSKIKSQNKRAPASSDVLPERGGSAEFQHQFARLQSVSASNIAVSAAYGNTVLNPSCAYPLMLEECLVHSSVPKAPSIPRMYAPVNRSGSPSSSVGTRHWCLHMPRGPVVLKFMSLSSPSLVQCHEFSSASGAPGNDKSGTNLDANESETPEQALTSGQKIKRAVKEYGTAVIVFHVTISLASLGFFYLLVSCGIDMGGLIQRLGIDLSEAAGAAETLDPTPSGSPADAGTGGANVSVSGTGIDDVSSAGTGDINKAEYPLNTTTTGGVNSSKLSTAGNVAAGVSTFVVAYAVHKVFAPLRVGITLSVVPFVVRYYRRNWKKTVRVN